MINNNVLSLTLLNFGLRALYAIILCLKTILFELLTIQKDPGVPNLTSWDRVVHWIKGKFNHRKIVLVFFPFCFKTYHSTELVLWLTP